MLFKVQLFIHYILKTYVGLDPINVGVDAYYSYLSLKFI